MLGTFRGSGGRMHPGHRLVFINTAIGLLALPTYLLAYIRPTLEAGELPYGPFESVYWFHLAAAVVSIPSAMLYLHAAAKSDSEGKRWQVLFVGYGLFDVSHIFLYTGAAFGLFHIIGFVFPLEAMLKGIVLCLTVLFDLVRKRYVRDWIHWLGVAWASMNIAQVLAGKAAQIVYEHFTN